MKKNPRIFVLADDLSGAAEIGGIAFNAGLSVRIFTGISDLMDYPDDVVVVDSNSRNLDRADAYERIRELVSSINLNDYDLVYKKVDSVLRGPVVAEMDAFLDSSGKKSAILIPANPSMGRTIREGCYYIDEKPIHTTWFSSDPEYPRHSMHLRDLISGFSDDMVLVYPDNPEPPRAKVLIPDISTREDLVRVVSGLAGKEVLYVGASDFFEELLTSKLMLPMRKRGDDREIRGIKHFVIGSISESSRAFTGYLAGKEHPLFYLPVPAIDNDPLFREWLSMIEKEIEKGSAVAVSGPERQVEDLVRIDRITIRLADTAKRIAEKSGMNCHILIEGGKTASMFLRTLSYHELRIISVYETGAVTLASPLSDLVISIKPGSYVWPDSLLP